MCKWGTNTEVTLFEPRTNGMKTAKVDSCIAPIVQALNDAGIKTIASCCGHNNRPGNIILDDGRELFIVPNYEFARKLDSKLPKIQGEIMQEIEEEKTQKLWEEKEYKGWDLAYCAHCGKVFDAEGSGCSLCPECGND
jgi:hypothetical protein